MAGRFKNPFRTIKAEKWRKELVSMRFKGIDMDKCVEVLTEKYDIKESTIIQTWYQRHTWIDKVFDVGFDTGEDIIKDIASEEKMVKESLWRLLDKASTKDSINLLKEINKVNKDLLQMLQETGVIDKVADRVVIKDDLKDKLKSDDDLKNAVLQIYRAEKGKDANIEDEDTDE